MEILFLTLFLTLVILTGFVTYSAIFTYKNETKYWRERVHSESAYRDKYFSMLIELFDVTEKTLKEDLYPEQVDKIMSKIRHEMNEKFPEKLCLKLGMK